MRYLSISLTKYKRIQLDANTRIFIRFDNTTQIILGTNGSGKSSIVAELTPLPSNKKHYLDGGGKVVVAEHNNNQYQFSSMKDGDSMRHSFVKNGVELNPGGTAPVQTKLAYQEFYITPDTHLLSLSKLKFTDMSATDRRQWFTRMADANFDFALSLYGKLKGRANVVYGSLKRTRERLVSEVNKQLKPEDRAQLKKEVAELHDALTLLLENRSPITKPIVDCERDLQYAVNELNQMSQRLFTLKFEAPYGTNALMQPMRDDWGVLRPVHYNSISEVDEAIQRFNQEIAVCTALQNEAFLQNNKLKEARDILEKTGTEGKEVLEMKLEVLRTARDATRNSSKLKFVFTDPLAASSSYTAIEPVLKEVFENIPINDNRQFTGAGRDEMVKRHADLKEASRQLQLESNRATSQKEHMESHRNNKHLTCPKCSHTWSDGYDENRYQELVKKIEDLIVKYADNEKQLKQVEKDLEEWQAYSALYRQYMQVVNSTPVLRPFWDYLSDKQTITHYPRTGVNELYHLDNTIKAEVEAAKIDREIDEVVKLIAAKIEMGDQSLTEVVSQMASLEVKIESLTNQMAELTNAVAKHQQYRRQLAQSAELAVRIEQQLTKVEDIRTETVEMIRRDTLNHCIRQLQSNLSTKEETLKSMEMQAVLIADLENQIQVLTVEDEAVKNLVRELSPTDGLIAEGLLGFIADFTKKMNGLIKEIWSYPLVIHTCQPNEQGEAELDFKFPMSVNRRDNVVDDVSLGSTGIVQVIDLAFKIVAQHCLKQENFPLILDEFGTGFDEVHRIEAGKAIGRLIEHHNFSQLFMISHYSASYGTLPHAQICVLHAGNITVPEKYNEHVVFE